MIYPVFGAYTLAQKLELQEADRFRTPIETIDELDRLYPNIQIKPDPPKISRENQQRIKQLEGYIDQLKRNPVNIGLWRKIEASTNITVTSNTVSNGRIIQLLEEKICDFKGIKKVTTEEHDRTRMSAAWLMTHLQSQLEHIQASDICRDLAGLRFFVKIKQSLEKAKFLVPETIHGKILSLNMQVHQLLAMRRGVTNRPEHLLKPASEAVERPPAEEPADSNKMSRRIFVTQGR